LRDVRLPSGWAGLSFRCSEQGRLLVTEVPKACFSSASYGARAAGQVAGVHPGDEVVLINGEAPLELAKRICSTGDLLNHCQSSSAPHAPGDQGKLANPPCISCDFLRRNKALGLDVALQMWMRAVKSDQPITLGIRSASASAGAAEAPPVGKAAGQPPASAKAPTGQPAGPPPPTPAAKEKKEAPAGTPPAGPPPTPAAKEKKEAPAPAYNPLKPAAAYNPLKPTAAAYNPLRPAAAKAAAAQVGAPAAKAAAKAPPPPSPKMLPLLSPPGGGLEFEEPNPGPEKAEAARVNSKVEIKFNVIQKDRKFEKVLERGQIECRLGQAEVLDGWVTGNVDMEEVLAVWGHSLVGAKVGSRRRIHVPPGDGFEAPPEVFDGKKEKVQKGRKRTAMEESLLIFDAELRRLLPDSDDES